MKRFSLRAYTNDDAYTMDVSISKYPQAGSDGSKPNPVTPQLLESIRQGDHYAFEVVFKVFHPRIAAFLRAFTKSEDAADELSQETFINLWTKRDQIDPDKNFNAYIYTIARNAALNYFYRKNPLINYPDCSIFDSSYSETPEDHTFARETELLVKLIVNQMPSQRKKVFEMSRQEQKTNDEIASELGITKKAVEKHLRLALNDIRHVVKILMLILFI